MRNIFLINILVFLMPMLLLNNAFSNQKSTSQRVSIKVTTEIEVSPTVAFEYIVPVELSHIFKRYKNLAAITGTSNKEKWYTPGMQRTVFFEDGSTVQEYLLTVHPHNDFSYKIDNFTSPLRKLATYIEGHWKFTQTKEGHTAIEWTYTIYAKNRFTKFLITNFVKKNVRTLLNNALLILKTDLENLPTTNG